MNETVIMIKLSELHPFPGNPFKVTENEDLDEIVESIKAYGVINPIIVRPREEGGYEIIAGHRRKRACEKAGVNTIPAFIRNMDKNTAVISLVDSNLHREHILPSEKAFAYKMKLEAIKHQGKAIGQPVHKSRDLVAENNESGRQVQRYIRLTQLIPPILQMVDDRKIAFGPAVELSYLAGKEQYNLFETMKSEDCTPSLPQAQRMKKLSKDGLLDMNMIFAIMTEEKPNQKEQIKLPRESIKEFFPNDYTAKQMEEVILKLLADWQRKREHNKNKER